MPGMTELLIIGGVIVLLFGGSKLPKLGGAIGESIRNFKKGIKEEENTAAPRIADKKDDDAPKA
ncbi:MAG: twin-arginine translocase TatA/TatE family subunit [Bdellovibrionota bacterium]|nr:MAG: twin-arginine translocase TatA/TatE family subunit [Pseudomonadota bacterium]